MRDSRREAICCGVLNVGSIGIATACLARGAAIYGSYGRSSVKGYCYRCACVTSLIGAVERVYALIGELSARSVSNVARGAGLLDIDCIQSNVIRRNVLHIACLRVCTRADRRGSTIKGAGRLGCVKRNAYNRGRIACFIYTVEIVGTLSSKLCSA